MSEQNDQTFKTYLEHLRTGMTGNTLLTSFIFTALTLLLMGLEDVTSLLPQATLLVLLIAFLLVSLQLGIIQVREALITGHTVTSKLSTLSTPGFKVVNLLSFTSILLWNASVVLMFFVRGLIYLGGISIVLVGSFYLVYIVVIIVPTQKAFKKMMGGQK